jgi:transcriptional regulator with GAF, ATPase, and Fis domain
VLFSRSQPPAPSTLDDALLDLAEAPASEGSIQQALRRLAEGANHLVLACVWLRCSGNACAACQTSDGCSPADSIIGGRSATDGEFHLTVTAAPAGAEPGAEQAFRGLASAGADIARALSQQSPTMIAGSFDILPAVAEWARSVHASSFWGQRLVYRDMDLGAFGLFLNGATEPSNAAPLRLLAAQIAMALANERLLREVERLRRDPPERLRSGKAVFSEEDVRRFERENILAALEATKGRVYGRGGAAELLGLKPTTLASRLKKLGISIRAQNLGA